MIASDGRNPELPLGADLERAVETWLAHLRHDRGHAEKTLEAYARDVRQFLDYLAANLGYPPAGDIYEEPSTTVDAAVNFRPRAGWRIKLAGANLFDANYVIKQGEKVWRFAKPGRTASLSLSFGS